MALRLRVVSEHRRLLGERSTAVFGVSGGTIGRSADNDWILPDPLRYISAHHARIHFRQGQYFLEDVSTNGSFVNDDERPLGKQGPYALRHGDVLRFGEYQVVVAVDAANDASHEPKRAQPETPTSINVLRGVSQPGDDIGASLNLDELLVPDSSPSDSFGPRDAYGQRAAASIRSGSTPPASIRSSASPAAAAALEAAREVQDDDESEAIARRIERLAKAAARDRKNGGGPQLYDVSTGLQAFCRGAGVDADRLPAEAQTRLLHLAGQLFREALVGFKDLDRCQRDERNRFRIELPVDPEDSRPQLGRTAVDDLVVELLKQHESRRIDAVQWLRETLATAKHHEHATSEAMRSAFVEFVDRLDPDELDTRFERAARTTKSKSGDRSRHWEFYVEFYRNLTEMPQGHLPHTFVEAFSKAYREALDTANTAKNRVRK
jgi:type VI secretion system FHA domain protein